MPPKTGVCEGGQATEYVAQPYHLSIWAHRRDKPRGLRVGNYGVAIEINGDMVYFPVDTNGQGAIAGNWYSIDTVPSAIFAQWVDKQGGQYAQTLWEESKKPLLPIRDKEFCYEKIGDPIYERGESSQDKQ